MTEDHFKSSYYFKGISKDVGRPYYAEIYL